MAPGGKKAKQGKQKNEKRAAQRRASTSQTGAPRAPTQLPHEGNTRIGCTTLHSFTIVAFDSAPLSNGQQACIK
jgi:hypothetical protein